MLDPNYAKEYYNSYLKKKTKSVKWSKLTTQQLKAL